MENYCLVCQQYTKRKHVGIANQLELALDDNRHQDPVVEYYASA